jgi:hypothetical protein
VEARQKQMKVASGVHPWTDVSRRRPERPLTPATGCAYLTLAPVKDVRVERFEYDDAGYELAGYLFDLFVLNTARNHAPDYLVLHRATWRAIAGVPARGTGSTGAYIKFCGRRMELEDFGPDLTR